ncbi:hypothetical protein K402DRAFT_452932 [Aulographum hederae CBS 113979]|uniref:Protein kinase domain-containing protein n=1 Tax=Aulographum hederae CBS 113979 TaxID=1176131 RepID=A0A6G1H5I5_9PEZI|nr:hypothetical protein K402DRAFT_452932 [Aulographum hederae CBS 113979]
MFRNPGHRQSTCNRSSPCLKLYHQQIRILKVKIRRFQQNLRIERFQHRQPRVGHRVMVPQAYTNRVHPYYTKPRFDDEQRPPLLQVTPRGWFAGIYDPFITAAEVAPGVVSLIPNGFARDSEDWADEEDDDFEADGCYKTCIAYEKIGENHEAIVEYRGRDPSTGFPLLAKPTGPPLDIYISQNREKIWPPGRRSVAAESFPLVISWALQALAALAFLHSKEVYFGSLGAHACWLQEDISIKLVGFVDADFVDGYGEKNVGLRQCGPDFTFEEDESGTVQNDLFDWASMVYGFVTGVHVDEAPDWVQGSTRSVPNVSEEGDLGMILTNCWKAQYQSASELVPVESIKEDEADVFDGKIIPVLQADYCCRFILTNAPMNLSADVLMSSVSWHEHRRGAARFGGEYIMSQ